MAKRGTLGSGVNGSSTVGLRDGERPLELDVGAGIVVLRNRFGSFKPVRYGDPVWDTLDGARARMLAVEPDGMIQLGDNEGRPLPDLRHPEQVRAY